MQVKDLVGEAAGQIWHLLDSNGPQTLPQLKKELNGSDRFLDFAIGWLVREDKIDISQEGKSLRLRLR
jgi:winged helix-turn-helix protein DUF2582